MKTKKLSVTEKLKREIEINSKLIVANNNLQNELSDAKRKNGELLRLVDRFNRLAMLVNQFALDYNKFGEGK